MARTPTDPVAAHSETAVRSETAVHDPAAHSGMTHAPASHDEHVHLAAIRATLYDGEAIHRIYRGHGSGVDLLAVTSQRLIMIERTVWDGQLALTSVPFSRVTAVSLVTQGDQEIDRASTVGFRVTSISFVLHCADAEQAREAHDLINWPLFH